MGNIIMEPMNIIFPLQGEEVWLAIKTRKIGVGLWNGYGGKLEKNETPEQAGVRELRKESTLETKAEDYERVAIIDFYVHKTESEIKLNRCFVLFIRKWEGEPNETEEMANPKLFLINKIPYNKTIVGTEFWMPQVLKGDNIHGEIHYNANRSKIIDSIHITRLKPAELYSVQWNHYKKAVR